MGTHPSSNKGPKGGRRPIDARLETVADRPTFRGPLSRQRCIIPADGWYEWMPGTPKRPHCTRSGTGHRSALVHGTTGRHRPRRRTPPTHHTFTILTEDAREDIAWMHDRMPVILDIKQQARWLDPGQPDRTLLAELRVHDRLPLTTTGVSTEVNSPRADLRAHDQLPLTTTGVSTEVNSPRADLRAHDRLPLTTTEVSTEVNSPLARPRPAGQDAAG